MSRGFLDTFVFEVQMRVVIVTLGKVKPFQDCLNRIRLLLSCFLTLKPIGLQGFDINAICGNAKAPLPSPLQTPFINYPRHDFGFFLDFFAQKVIPNNISKQHAYIYLHSHTSHARAHLFSPPMTVTRRRPTPRSLLKKTSPQPQPRKEFDDRLAGVERLTLGPW